jgi:5'(3')-deoxyribonucleotidase
VRADGDTARDHVSGRCHRKHQWVERYFPGLPVIVVAYAREKSRYARPGDILIDDSADNLRRWARRVRGVAIAYDAVAPKAVFNEIRRLDK